MRGSEQEEIGGSSTENNHRDDDCDKFLFWNMFLFDCGEGCGCCCCCCCCWWWWWCRCPCCCRWRCFCCWWLWWFHSFKAFVHLPQGQCATSSEGKLDASIHHSKAIFLSSHRPHHHLSRQSHVHVHYQHHVEYIWDLYGSSLITGSEWYGHLPWSIIRELIAS